MGSYGGRCRIALTLTVLWMTLGISATGHAAAPPSGPAVQALLRDDMRLPSEQIPHGAEALGFARQPRLSLGNNPGTFSDLLAWGQLYECASGNAQPAARVELKDLDAWLLSRTTGRWTRVQHTVQVHGQAYREDYSENDAVRADARQIVNGGTSATVGNGRNYHFWPADNTAIQPDDVAGLVVTIRARLAPRTVDAALAKPCFVLSVGADYWLPRAQWDHGKTNADAGIGRFKLVRTRWRLFTMSTIEVDAQGPSRLPLGVGAAELR
jgi:hypothetical protein